MTLYDYIKTIVLSIFLGSVSLLHAEVRTHPFDVESGMVIYEISGGGQLTPETNLTIQGHAKLRFKEWGEVKLEEEEGLLRTTGAITHKQHIKRLEKHTLDTIVTADYENEKLLERKKGSSSQCSQDETDSLVQTGQESVAGVLCDVWEGPGIKKCIYKNIVLRSESTLYDISYVRVATKAVFDINTSDDECKTPDYPVQEFALFKDNIKTKNIYKSENFCKILKDQMYDLDEYNISGGLNTVTEEERKTFINHIAKDIYKKQKKVLPRLLKSMKKSRECLQTAEDPLTANHCMEPFNQMKEKLGREKDAAIILWDDEGKNRLLDTLEDEVIYLQSRMPCVKRAKNMTDLSACMK